MNEQTQLDEQDIFISTNQATAQKMKFSIKDFFSKCDQDRKEMRIWSHLLKKSLMENFHFLCSVNNFLYQNRG